MITSLSNPHVKLVRSLARRRTRYDARQFVIEGVRLVEEGVESGANLVLVLHAASAGMDPRCRGLLERLSSTTTPVYTVGDSVMEAITRTETPQGILAVLPFVDLPVPLQPQLILILDAVRDPGNVGTIMRSARAAGVNEIVFAPNTADPYNDKVVRAAMGAHFHVPLRVAQSWVEIENELRGVPRIYLADPRGQVAFTHADWRRPVALIVGGEAEGASATAEKLATLRVYIPMEGGTESLNAAMAATLLLFEAKSQRIPTLRE